MGTFSTINIDPDLPETERQGVERRAGVEREAAHVVGERAEAASRVDDDLHEVGPLEVDGRHGRHRCERGADEGGALHARHHVHRLVDDRPLVGEERPAHRGERDAEPGHEVFTRLAHHARGRAASRLVD
jgi:hypothetical protein